MGGKGKIRCHVLIIAVATVLWTCGCSADDVAQNTTIRFRCDEMVSKAMNPDENMVRDLSYTTHKKETMRKIQQLLNILNISNIDQIVPPIPTPSPIIKKNNIPKKSGKKPAINKEKRVKKKCKKRAS